MVRVDQQPLGIVQVRWVVGRARSQPYAHRRQVIVDAVSISVDVVSCRRTFGGDEKRLTRAAGFSGNDSGSAGPHEDELRMTIEPDGSLDRQTLERGS